MIKLLFTIFISLFAIVIFLSPSVQTTHAASSDLIITEIMYNNSQVNSDQNWEWVEIYNAGAGTVDLSGYVLDDRAGSHYEISNIASGSINSGDTAILVNSDNAAAFNNAWGGGLNVVAVSSWSTLNNDGDHVGIWSSIGAYDDRNFSSAIDSVDYKDTGAWPSDNDASSIYLKDTAAGSAEIDLGDAWGLSTNNDNGAFLGGHGTTDIGSPMVVHEPISNGLIEQFVIFGNISPNSIVAGNTFSFIGGIKNTSGLAVNAKIEARITGSGFDERVIPGTDVVPITLIPTQVFATGETKTGAVTFDVNSAVTPGEFVYTVHVDVGADGTVDDTLSMNIAVTSSREGMVLPPHSEWFNMVACEGSLCETSSTPTSVAIQSADVERSFIGFAVLLLSAMVLSAATLRHLTRQ